MILLLPHRLYDGTLQFQFSLQPPVFPRQAGRRGKPISRRPSGAVSAPD